MSATALCHVLPSSCNILRSFLDTPAPGLSQQSQAVHLLLLPSTSCLMPALSSHLHGHPLLFPLLVIVVSPMPSYRVLSKSLPATQAGKTSGYNSLDQLSALPVRNRTPRDIPQRTPPGPSAASCPFLFSLPFSFHPAKVLHLLSSLFIFTLSCIPFLFFHKAFFSSFSQTGVWVIWPEMPQISGQESQEALVYKPFGPQNKSRNTVLLALIPVPVDCLLSGKQVYL